MAGRLVRSDFCLAVSCHDTKKKDGFDFNGLFILLPIRSYLWIVSITSITGAAGQSPDTGDRSPFLPKNNKTREGLCIFIGDGLYSIFYEILFKKKTYSNFYEEVPMWRQVPLGHKIV